MLRDSSPVPAQAPDDPVRWRVPGARIGLRFAAAGAFVLAGLLLGAGEPATLVLALLAAAGLAGLAVRDLVARERLAADRDGVTVVAGFARRRRLPWSEIERVRVDARQRLGTRTEQVEIDAGESLYLFSPQELGAPAGDVVDELTARRPDPA